MARPQIAVFNVPLIQMVSVPRRSCLQVAPCFRPTARVRQKTNQLTSPARTAAPRRAWRNGLFPLPFQRAVHRHCPVGGGAANFSAAALQNLDDLGLLRGANIISSVSGGGLAGAYYALNSPAMDWDILRHKLDTNFLAIFFRKWAAPWHWPEAAFTDETKTDIMADVFDEVLFSRKT
jgi:NTE family protein